MELILQMCITHMLDKWRKEVSTRLLGHLTIWPQKSFLELSMVCFQLEFGLTLSIMGSSNYLLFHAGYAADWWSVGIILFELITGIPPFTAERPEVFFVYKFTHYFSILVLLEKLQLHCDSGIKSSTMDSLWFMKYFFLSMRSICSQ